MVILFSDCCQPNGIWTLFGPNIYECLLIFYFIFQLKAQVTGTAEQQSKDQEPALPSLTAAGDDDEEEAVVVEDDELPTIPPPKSKGSKAKPTPSSTSAGNQELLDALSARAVQSERLQQKLENFVTNTDTQSSLQANWGSWFADCCKLVPVERWEEFCDQSYRLVKQFVSYSVPPVPVESSALVAVSSSPLIVSTSATVPSVSTVSISTTSTTTISPTVTPSVMSTPTQSQSRPMSQSQSMIPPTPPSHQRGPSFQSGRQYAAGRGDTTFTQYAQYPSTQSQSQYGQLDQAFYGQSSQQHSFGQSQAGPSQPISQSSSRGASPFPSQDPQGMSGNPTTPSESRFLDLSTPNLSSADSSAALVSPYTLMHSENLDEYSMQ